MGIHNQKVILELQSATDFIYYLPERQFSLDHVYVSDIGIQPDGRLHKEAFARSFGITLFVARIAGMVYNIFVDAGGKRILEAVV